jgi:uncharacterized protein (TIGR04255 family)
MPLPEPFSGQPPAEVPLVRAPLVRVLAQIRFPTINAVVDPAAVAPFQERIRATYPIGNKEVIQHLAFNAETAQAIKAEPESIWRFEDRDKQWRVSLSPNFLALETTRYTSRKDFLDRMTTLIAALEQTLNPQLTQRVGLRYIDRIEDDAIDRLHDLIKPEFLGAQRLFSGAIRHALTDTQLNTDEGAVITARWGSLPPNATTDPNVLEPAKGHSWVLDLDMFTDRQGDFTAAVLAPQLEAFAKRIYAVFRFMVTPTFLEHYGRQ